MKKEESGEEYTRGEQRIDERRSVTRSNGSTPESVPKKTFTNPTLIKRRGSLTSVYKNKTVTGRRRQKKTEKKRERERKTRRRQGRNRKRKREREREREKERERK